MIVPQLLFSSGDDFFWDPGAVATARARIGASKKAVSDCMMMISFPGPLLERDEHEHEPLALFEAGHRLADDRALGLRRVSDLHRVAGRARCRQQVPGSIAPCEASTQQ